LQLLLSAHNNSDENMKFKLTIEGLSATLGQFAAYFALYESYIMCFKQPPTLEEELGTYYLWFIKYSSLDKLAASTGIADMTTTSEQAQFVAIWQMLAALAVILLRNKLYGLCLFSWFYMTAVRGHVMLQTKYVPVVMTMFGFTHVALVALVLGSWLGDSESSSAGETTADESMPRNKDENDNTTETKAAETRRKKTNPKKKAKAN
jgi:hypothetical protein